MTILTPTEIYLALDGNSSVLPIDVKEGIKPPSSGLVSSKFLDLQTGLPVFYNAAIVVATLVFVILIIIGGVRYLASAGNEQGTEQAKRLILSAVIGLALVLGTWAILLFVFQLTGYHFGS